MKTKDQLRSRIACLERQVRRLQAEQRKLNAEKNIRLRHVKSSTGSRGEKYIHRLLDNSIPTGSGAGHDLVVAGKRLEIKTSECRSAIDGRRNGTLTKRWTWHRPFGTSGENHYHFLVLVGDIDSRHRRLYRDKEKPPSRFVLFVIPRHCVKHVMRQSGEPIIQITTNPLIQRSKAGKQIWRYEKTRKEIKTQFAA